MTEPTKFDRLDQELDWYARNADRKQRAFYGFKSLQIILGMSIPICSLVTPDAKLANIINGVLGTVIAALESYLQLGNTERNWQRWRSSAEALKREKWLFLQNAGSYADPASPKSSEILLAERVEEIISREHNDWLALQTRPGPDRK